MNHTLAIDVNRKALLQVVAALFVMAGDAVVAILPRRVHLEILDILRPAESAVRRLIAMLAHGLTVPVIAARTAPVAAIPKSTGTRVPAFRLFDPRKRIGPIEKRVPGNGPGVRNFDSVQHFAPAKQAPTADDPIDATRLCNRLLAVKNALDHLPRQARRLARALAKQERPMRVMRPGRPPGYRDKWRHPVDEILDECQKFALIVLSEPPATPP